METIFDMNGTKILEADKISVDSNGKVKIIGNVSIYGAKIFEASTHHSQYDKRHLTK